MNDSSVPIRSPKRPTSRQKRLRESEERYRNIFEHAVIAIWEEDFTKVKTLIDHLRAEGIADFRAYLADHPNVLQQAMELISILDANEAMLQLFGAREKSEVIGGLDRFLTPEHFQDEFIAFAEGKPLFERDIFIQSLDGRKLDLLLTVRYFTDVNGTTTALVHLSDITQRKQAEESLRSQNEYLALLNEINLALSETERVGTDKVLQLIVDSARKLIQLVDESVIHLLDKDILIPRAISGFEEGTIASERPIMGWKDGVAGHVIDTGKTINIGDINANPLYVLKESSPTYRSLLVAPIQSGERPIGTISVQSNKLNAFSMRDEELLNALSVQASIAIENTRLFEKIQQSLKEANALYHTNQGLAKSLDTDELIEDVVNLLQQNFGYYHTQVYLIDPANGDLILKSGSGEIGVKLLEKEHRLSRGVGITGHAAETATPFVTNNVNEIMFFYREPLLPDTQSEMAVPIKADGKVMGVIDIQDKPPRELTDNDLQLVIIVADQLSVALQRASLYATLQTSLRQEQMIRSQLLQSERLALVGRLLASVSHELNNPLQAIQNALFLLKEESGLSSQGSQDLDIVLSETERMAALIERLRTAYRPVRGKDFQPVQLNNLIEDVFALIGTHMRHKSILFEFIPDPDLHPVSGISDQLRQVVLNLFLNAVEVMKPGGRLTVQTRNVIDNREVLFTVKDTGPGIDEEILPRIFDAFITNKHTGTGLGLTITHDILEQHRGRINAENDPQGGAIFLVWLPMAEKE